MQTEPATGTLHQDAVAAVIHELRAPLTSIQGSIKTILETGEDLDPETRASLLDAIDRQSDRLARLLDDLMVAARLDAEPISPATGPVSLRAVTEAVVEEFRARGTHRLVIEAEAGPCTVDTDERKVEHILSNLMDNALKYSPKGSTVTVRLRREGDGLAVSVEDQGPGIPEHLRERIFDRFYQGAVPARGAGLGLYICRRLAETIDARVTLERSDKDGSTFTVAIPGAR
jgi:two-component system sensor histidine kinase KdpD